MTIGSGIALAAVWAFATACALSKQVSGGGLFLAMGVALAATCFIAANK